MVPEAEEVMVAVADMEEDSFYGLSLNFYI